MGDWFARLATVDMSRLSHDELDDLTLRRILAARAVQRESRRLAQGPEHGDSSTSSLDSDDLRRCKEAIRVLSAEDRRRLLRWVEKHLPE